MVRRITCDALAIERLGWVEYSRPHQTGIGHHLSFDEQEILPLERLHHPET